MQVGFIGIGDQGGPMADAIAEKGFGLHIWARRPEAAAAYAGRATLHDTPKSLAAAVDALCLCVVAEQDVRGLLFDQGCFDALRPGALIVIHVTMAPAACRELADEAAKRGLALVDAPVSGGRLAAINRKLLVLTGADEQSFDRARPVLETFGDRVVHLGPVGSGQVSKILNNFLMNANMASALVVLELAEDLGIARERAREMLLQGTARSFSLEAIDTLIFQGKLPMTLGKKDIALALDLAADGNVARRSIDLVAELGLLGRERMAGGPKR